MPFAVRSANFRESSVCGVQNPNVAARLCLFAFIVVLLFVFSYKLHRIIATNAIIAINAPKPLKTQPIERVGNTKTLVFPVFSSFHPGLHRSFLDRFLPVFDSIGTGFISDFVKDRDIGLQFTTADIPRILGFLGIYA